MNIFDLLEIDPLKDSALPFASQFTDSGYVGGGGAGFGGGPDYPMGGTGGGGAVGTTAARTSLASLIVMARTCAAAAGVARSTRVLSLRVVAGMVIIIGDA